MPPVFASPQSRFFGPYPEDIPLPTVRQNRQADKTRQDKPTRQDKTSTYPQRQIDRRINKPTDTQTGRQRYKPTGRDRLGQTDRDRQGQTETETDRDRDRQRDRQTPKQNTIDEWF